MKQKVRSFSDIESLFDKAYDDSFNYSCVYQIRDKSTHNDVAMQYFMEHEDAWNKFCHANNSVEQDKLVSCIKLSHEPELKSHYKSLDDEDLSVETVFDLNTTERELPEIIDDSAGNFEATIV